MRKSSKARSILGALAITLAIALVVGSGIAGAHAGRAAGHRRHFVQVQKSRPVLAHDLSFPKRASPFERQLERLGETVRQPEKVFKALVPQVAGL